MKLGMNLLLYTVSPDDSTFKIAEDLLNAGYDGMEWPVFAIDQARGEAIAKFNSDHGITGTAIAVLGEGQDPLSDDESQRKSADESIRQLLDMAAAMNAELLAGPLVQPLGHFTGNAPTETEMDRCVEFLQKSGEYAQSVNVKLVVEYLNRFEIYAINTAAATRRLLDRVNHPFVMGMIDSFHSNIEEKNLKQAVCDLGDKLIHVHISENDRGVPGSGQIISWDDFFAGLKEVGYDGWLMIEAFDKFLKEIAGAAKVWRPLFDKPEDVSVNGLAFMKEMAAKHGLM